MKEVTLTHLREKNSKTNDPIVLLIEDAWVDDIAWVRELGRRAGQHAANMLKPRKVF